jgi:hypothetical protein
MTAEARVISEGAIDIYADGTMRWAEDGEPLDRCADCGTQGFEDWHVPDLVWEQYRKPGRHLGGTAEFLCWPCFLLRILRAERHG